MATSPTTKPVEAVTADLIAALHHAAIFPKKQVEEIRSKIRDGRYPAESIPLARRLVTERILTEFQARCLLYEQWDGLRIGRYVILTPVGRGSMGRVYKARHLLLGRSVAMKIIGRDVSSRTRATARLQREMWLVSRLDHPNIVRALDADRYQGVLYLVMEYISGQDLEHLLEVQGPFPAAEAAEYAAQAALGLAHAHERGIIHRDIKPSNLMRNRHGQIKILDLGLGTLADPSALHQDESFATVDGAGVGTVEYMSPEQATGRPLDGRSDLYSLGCTTYHLLTGAVPFPGDSKIERLARRIHGRPEPIVDLRSDVPPALVAVLDRMMATRPEDRYPTGLDAAEALRAAVGVEAADKTVVGTAPSDPPQVIAADPPPAAVPDLPKAARALTFLIERSPVSFPLVLLAALLLAAAAGFALGRVLG